ncbi:BTB/POZ domain [Globodera pallida]|nr:BTB/POZ domain [Globodera pallida]
MQQNNSNLRYPIRFMRMMEPSPNVNRATKRLEMVSKQTTKVAAISSRLEWRIDHFEKLMKLMKNGQNLISKQFSCTSCSTVVWELHVYPNGKREEDVNNVSFFLRQVGLQRGEDPVMTEFQIYALDASDCRISVCRDTKDFSNQQGRGKFQVHRDKMLASLRPDGSLLLFCEVEFLPPGVKLNVEKEDDELLEDVGVDSAVWVQESLRDMWQQETFTDCIIQVGTTRLNAHRCILAQHSGVFRSMFQQKTMVEAQNGVINITDSRPEHIRAMLQFIYTGTVDNLSLENSAEGILAIADKYAIMTLKERCERFLASTINAKNVTNLCLIADTYFASLLKKACTKFISTNHKSVLRSPEWKELKTHRGTLANELLESVLDHAGGESVLEMGSSFDGGNSETLGASSFGTSNFAGYLFARNNPSAAIAANLNSLPVSASSSSNASSNSSAFHLQSSSSTAASSHQSFSTTNAPAIVAPGASAQQQQQSVGDAAGDEDSRTPVRKRLRRKL